MNVYEEAHALERAIKDSEEYKQYKAAKDKVEANEQLKGMLDDFHKKHITFVKKYSEVKFLEERFGIIEFKIV